MKENNCFPEIVKMFFGLGFISFSIISFLLGFKLLDVITQIQKDAGVGITTNEINLTIAFFLIAGCLALFLGIMIICDAATRLNKTHQLSRLQEKSQNNENALKSLEERFNNVEEIVKKINTKYCPNCKQEVSENQEYCFRCGQQLKNSQKN